MPEADLNHDRPGPVTSGSDRLAGSLTRRLPGPTSAAVSDSDLGLNSSLNFETASAWPGSDRESVHDPT